MYRAEVNIEDCRYVLDNLREEDKAEVLATRGENWKEDILNDLSNTPYPFLLAKTKQDDIPVLICGAWSTDINNPSVGIVWLLATPEIEKHQISFLKEMRKEINKYDEQFGILYNQIYMLFPVLSFLIIPSDDLLCDMKHIIVSFSDKNKSTAYSFYK